MPFHKRLVSISYVIALMTENWFKMRQPLIMLVLTFDTDLQ